MVGKNCDLGAKKYPHPEVIRWIDLTYLLKAS